jgi:hypothetical protein
MALPSPPLPLRASRGTRCLLLMLVVLGWAGPAGAAETAVVQEILDGKELFIDQHQAKVQHKARAPQQLTTRNSRGQILFNGGAVGRLNKFSHLRLGSSCFLVDKGQVLISGNQNGCTRTARLSVRGTNYLIEVNEAGESDISVLEGRVEVERLEDGQQGASAPSILEAGQRLRLSPRGVVLALLKLEAGDYERLLNGPLFQGYRLPIPGAGSLEAHLKSRFPGLNLPLPIGGSVLPLPQPPPRPVPPFGLPRLF